VHFKRKLVIATSTLAAAAFGGGAYAATKDSTGNLRQAFLNDVAKRLNVSPADLSAALTGAFQDQLTAAVKAGKLTQAQADALARGARKRGFAPLWFGGREWGMPRLFGPGGPGSPGLGGAGGSGGQGGLAAPGRPGSPADGPFGAAAKYLGVTANQLFDQLRAGKSLAQVAGAERKSTDGLKQAMVGAVKPKLDQAVADKRITSAQEQQILGNLSSRIGNEINEKAPAQPGGHEFFGPRGFFRGHPGRLPGALEGPARGTPPGPFA
jgi:hypothetical protein